jgi:AraC family transcriptional regulator of arabinose operon
VRLDERVRRAIELLELEPGQTVSCDGLASSLYLSVSRFAHLFRQQTGTTPMRMLRSIRLQRAAQLLSLSQVPIKEIAGTLGFRGVAHFGRLFKVRFGVTPWKFRGTAAGSGAVPQDEALRRAACKDGKTKEQQKQTKESG